MNFASGRKPLSVFSLAGLTDIVLLLLIFFLLTSNFVTQFGIKVNVPNADSAVSSEDRSLTVTITEDSRFFVQQQQTSADELAQKIRELRADHTGLVIRADREAPYKDIVRALSIGQALEMNLRLATERERSRR